MTAPTSSASGNTNESGPGPDASSADDATTGTDDAALADVAPEATGITWGAPDASCPRSGTFTCGEQSDAGCDRASQFCEGVNAGYGSCQPLSSLATVAYVMDSGTCGSCPTCDCIPPSYLGRTCTCFEDNYGGLTVSCSQAGCYGSPPARLERTPLRAIG